MTADKTVMLYDFNNNETILIVNKKFLLWIRDGRFYLLFHGIICINFHNHLNIIPRQFYAL